MPFALLRVCAALVVAALASTGDAGVALAPLDLANWMGQLAPILSPTTTLLDLSVPGSHDSMTFDLSTTLSDGYEGLGPVISKILHGLTPLIAGKFIREQGQTQGLNMTEQLDAGVRFIDLRIMFTDAPVEAAGRSAASSAAATKDWYCLHGCETRTRALVFLEAAHAWLEAHPAEILTLWSSRHGDGSLNGTNQYPSTTAAQRQAFWAQVVATFGSMLFDASASPLNETSVATMVARGERVVWYAADWAEFTNSSSRAQPSGLVDNNLPGAGAATGALGLFRRGAAQRASDKAANRYFLASLAASGPTCQVEAAALYKFLPIDRKGDVARCAKCLAVPGVDSWCPLTLMDYGLFNNYYNQRVLDAAWLEGARDAAVDFPNAIYIDAVDAGGRIRTGTARIRPLDARGGARGGAGAAAGAAHLTTGYAYAATLIGANVRRLCRAAAAPRGACAGLLAAVDAARAEAPLLLWNDTDFGRLATGWPALPPPLAA